MDTRPAWSWQFEREHLQSPPALELLDDISREWAWDGGLGQGIRVAVIDSGIDDGHPALGAPVRAWITPLQEGDEIRYDDSPHLDSYGHGTACAGIIRSLAPE